MKTIAPPARKGVSPFKAPTGILGFDTVEKRPVVIDDTIAIRHMVYISMSWDHRVIDGALASQFLARVKQNLETWDFAEDLAL